MISYEIRLRFGRSINMKSARKHETAPMAFTITPAGEGRRTTALQILFSRFPEEEQSAKLIETLRSAAEGRLNLDDLLLAESNGLPIGASLMIHQSDGITLIWPPVMADHAADRSSLESAMMEWMCDRIDQHGSKLAQALIDPENHSAQQLLQRFHFDEAADMYFLARQLIREDLEANLTLEEFDHELFTEENTNRFISVIERTYEHSLDCPFLTGFRSGNDAIHSHRLSGQFDPAGWRLYRIGMADVGVALMNDHPDQNGIELVYFGIVPEFRGNGFGRMMLKQCIQASTITGRDVIFLSVDCGNIYANTLYRELGFMELARRRVMLRRSTNLA